MPALQGCVESVGSMGPSPGAGDGLLSFFACGTIPCGPSTVGGFTDVTDRPTTPRPSFPRTERDKAPLYLATYLEKQTRQDVEGRHHSAVSPEVPSAARIRGDH